MVVEQGDEDGLGVVVEQGDEGELRVVEGQGDDAEVGMVVGRGKGKEDTPVWIPCIWAAVWSHWGVSRIRSAG